MPGIGATCDVLLFTGAFDFNDEFLHQGFKLSLLPAHDKFKAASDSSLLLRAAGIATAVGPTALIRNPLAADLPLEFDITLCTESGGTAVAAVLPQYQTTRAAREDGTIWSKKNNWSEVTEPPKALFVTGRGARSWAHVSHLRKMLLPTMRTPPGAGAGAAANFATSPVYLWTAGEGA